MKKFLLFVLPLVFGFGCQPTLTPEKLSVLNNQPKMNDILFCSPNGELVSTQTIQSHRTYCIQKENPTIALQTPFDLSFRIIDDQGNTLKDFQIVHEKIMHVIVVRRDLNEFQHIHPQFDASTGTFTLKNLSFKTEGLYRMYFDFTPQTAQMGAHGGPLGVTLHQDMPVGDTSKNAVVNLNDEAKVKTVDKFKVTLNPTVTLNETPEQKPATKIVTGEETKLYFQVEEKNGQPIDHVEKYLGEFGHLVIVKKDTLEYIHAHPVQSKTGVYNRIPFVVAFPDTGTYKLFLEFQYAGKVYMVDYTVTVSQGTEILDMDHHEMMTH